MRVFLSVLLLTTTAALAQTVKVGVVGGVSLTDEVRYAPDNSKPYVIGPSVEVKFFDGRFGVEFDALYRRTGTSYWIQPGGNPDYPQLPVRYSSATRGNTWEFPLLGKYYFRTSDAKFRPFLGTGYTVRNTWFRVADESVFSGNPQPVQSRRERSSGLEIGATAVAGMEWKVFGKVWLQPQFRYTRYGDRTDTLNRHQADFMLGIRF